MAGIYQYVLKQRMFGFQLLMEYETKVVEGKSVVRVWCIDWASRMSGVR